MKIEVKDLKKSFEGNEVLHGISFAFEKGKAFGLLGRNGAGKTTTIRILMDVFKANAGTITIDGKPFIPSEYQIGYMPEERGMYPKKKVMEQLIYFGELRGRNRSFIKEHAKKLLEKLEISDYADRKMETLSKGNQQKVQLAQTLICDPEIVILDEPFSGLDPVNSQILKDLIREEIERDKIVIFSSHEMSYVEEFCEDILIMKNGEIAIQGNLNEIKKEIGAQKGIVSAENYTLDELKDILETKYSDDLTVVDKKREFLVFEMKKEKSEIMKNLSNSDIDVSIFGDYKPSLTDIFVWKAGE